MLQRRVTVRVLGSELAFFIVTALNPLTPGRNSSKARAAFFYEVVWHGRTVGRKDSAGNHRDGEDVAEIFEFHVFSLTIALFSFIAKLIPQISAFFNFL